MPDWKSHFYRVGPHPHESDKPPEADSEINGHRKQIEPWLSAVCQSEHLSLLLGKRFATACANARNGRAASMGTIIIPER